LVALLVEVAAGNSEAKSRHHRLAANKCTAAAGGKLAKPEAASCDVDAGSGVEAAAAAFKAEAAVAASCARTAGKRVLERSLLLLLLLFDALLFAVSRKNSPSALLSSPLLVLSVSTCAISRT
jgi:hypothetical protein